MRHFAEEMRSPADNVGPQQVSDRINDPRMLHQLINPREPHVCRADGVAGFAEFNIGGQDPVEESTKLSRFFLIKTIERHEITLLVVLLDLLRFQDLWIGVHRWEKRHLPWKRGQLGRRRIRNLINFAHGRLLREKWEKLWEKVGMRNGGILTDLVSRWNSGRHHRHVISHHFGSVDSWQNLPCRRDIAM